MKTLAVLRPQARPLHTCSQSWARGHGATNLLLPLEAQPSPPFPGCTRLSTATTA